MFFIFDMQEEWTWNISNNHIIKSDVYIKLKYIQISLDIYINIYQYLTCIKVSFSNQNL